MLHLAVVHLLYIFFCDSVPKHNRVKWKQNLNKQWNKQHCRPRPPSSKCTIWMGYISSALSPLAAPPLACSQLVFTWFKLGYYMLHSGESCVMCVYKLFIVWIGVSTCGNKSRHMNSQISHEKFICIWFSYHGDKKFPNFCIWAKILS